MEDGAGLASLVRVTEVETPLYILGLRIQFLDEPQASTFDLLELFWLLRRDDFHRLDLSRGPKSDTGRVKSAEDGFGKKKNGWMRKKSRRQNPRLVLRV